MVKNNYKTITKISFFKLRFCFPFPVCLITKFYSTLSAFKFIHKKVVVILLSLQLLYCFYNFQFSYTWNESEFIFVIFCSGKENGIKHLKLILNKFVLLLNLFCVYIILILSREIVTLSIIFLRKMNIL